jgi:hypothetical protein
MKVEYSTLIHKTPAEVFSFIACYENDPVWCGNVLSSEILAPGSYGVSTLLLRREKLAGQQFSTEAEIIEFEKNLRSCWKSTSGPFPRLESRYCIPVENGTRFICTIEAASLGEFSKLSPLIVRLLQRQLKTDLANLKDLLEGEVLSLSSLVT